PRFQLTWGSQEIYITDRARVKIDALLDELTSGSNVVLEAGLGNQFLLEFVGREAEEARAGRRGRACLKAGPIAGRTGLGWHARIHPSVLLLSEPPVA